jgi:hypothetical protein
MAPAAIEIELQGVAYGHRDARLRRSLPHRDRRDQDLGELVANALIADRRVAAVERLETAGEESGRGEHNGEPRQRLYATFKPPH